MSNRLGGGKLTIEEYPTTQHIYKLSGMNEAVERYNTGLRIHPKGARRDRALENAESVTSAMMRGDSQLPAVLEKADRLIDDALALDPRLARKSSWRTCEPDTGIDADAALIAQGEERCCFERRKMRLNERATLEPLRIVISTDCREVDSTHAIAFVAAAKLAQQFRPLDLWWQGAWLLEKGEHRGNGHIILVPLVSGDLDFARLQFVLSSTLRDHASFNIMFSYAYPKYAWGGGVGEWSFLENTTDFVRESGIKSDPQSVARVAARWAGMDPLWQEEVSDYQALQWWDPKPYQSPPTQPGDRERWQREERERDRAKLQQANDRISYV